MTRTNRQPPLHRALLISGLIRDADRFADYLEGVLRLGRTDLRVILSTWTGELDRYPAIRALLAQLRAEIAEQTQPNLKLPGHMLHQVMSLDLGLSGLDNDVFVLKTRPDICGVMDVHEFLDLQPERTPPGRLGRPFGHRVHVVGMFGAQPLYINDIIFAGIAGDLRRLCALSFSHGLKYPRLAPEQWLWATVFLPGNPVLEAYLLVNPGLVFDDAPRHGALRLVLESSVLFARAVAVIAILVRDSLAYFHPDPHRASLMSECGGHTLEALLWDRLPGNGVDHHPNATTNTWLSGAFMDAVHDGIYQPSPFGERVRLAMARYGGVGGQNAMLRDRAEVMAEADVLARQVAVAMGQGEKQRPDDTTQSRHVTRGPAPWSLAETGAGYAAALEVEVNSLRRTVDRLQSRLAASLQV